MTENSKGKNVVIGVSEVTKSFHISSDRRYTLKERVIHRNAKKSVIHEVLKGINLEIKSGETVALIGQNGSGKSTLLKLLTGIMYPDKGNIQIKGKVSSLLELGAGFHPDFSGKENIYNNASIFGLSKKEIDQRYDKIVAFSELEEFIDAPVRTYSSGMYMRLAFSVAINVDADVLLIDEILAVGDTNFQKKCLDMIRHLKSRGVTIVIVTHDMGSVERICDRAVWLVDGVIRAQGKPREIIDMYLINMDEKADQLIRKEKIRDNLSNDVSQGETEFIQKEPSIKTDLTEYSPSGEKIRWGNSAVIITGVDFLDERELGSSLLMAGTHVTIRIYFRVVQHVESLVFGIAIKDNLDNQCLATNTDIRHVSMHEYVSDEARSYQIDFSFNHFDLAKGNYTLDVAAHSIEGTPYDYQLARYSFMISSSYADAGVYSPFIKITASKDH